MKKAIKKHLLPVLFWGLVWFCLTGGYFLINSAADIQRGYACVGTEDLLYFGSIFFLFAKKTIQLILKRRITK